MASRITFIILMLLAAGFIVNICVTWGLAFWDRASPSRPLVIERSAAEGPCWVYEIYAKAGWRQTRALTIPLAEQPPIVYGGNLLFHQFEDPMTMLLVPVAMDGGARVGVASPPELVADSVGLICELMQIDARGFPLPCLASRIMPLGGGSGPVKSEEQDRLYVHDGDFLPLDIYARGGSVEWGINLTPTSGTAIVEPLRILPLRPMLSGLIVNSVIYAILCSGLWLVALLTRGRWRQMHRHCPRCNYDLQPDVAAGCPECGWRRTDEEEPCSELDV